ncbi:MAG TPA: Xaa-Pro dipeptidyl-peptidase [Pilimelia sp.]|nr:Xaa-Pro dipeptidyl-peptidase [Pilimelia sp.]
MPHAPLSRPRAALAVGLAAAVAVTLAPPAAGAAEPAAAPVPAAVSAGFDAAVGTGAPAAVAGHGGTPAGRHRPPHVAGRRTVPVYSYADAIRESVFVEAPIDSDGDGARDRIAVDIVRPREAAEAGVRVPVIMVASPYYQCCGRGNEGEKKVYGPDGTVTKFPLFYDNYFVPRGYAFAAVDLTGTSRSTGCMDVGGRAEVLGAKAAVDWLNGRARGFTAAGAPVWASWTTGKVGMIGKSWDGSVANGVAATGVRGLETIVPIGAISSWYDYQRYHGVLRSRDYPVYLHNFVNGRPAQACAALRERLRAESGEDTGDYNAYWRERDYRRSAHRVRASVFIAHGINDLNVSTNQFARWWEALAEEGVPRKLWLFQSGHEEPFDVRRGEWVDTLHRWFDYWLQGLRNGVTREPRVTIEASPGVWRDQRDWPARGTRDVALRLGAGDGTTGTLGTRRAPRGTVQSYTDQAQSENSLVTSPTTAKPGRLVYLSGPLEAPLHVSGRASVRLRIKVDKPTTQLSARLVDYGRATRINHFSSEGVRTLDTESCWGESTAADDACYRDTENVVATTDQFVLARGWLDAAHHRSLRFATPLQPDRWYTVTVPLMATEGVIAAGHVVGLVLGQSDPQFTAAVDADATVQVDLNASALVLPAAGRVAVPSVTVAPELPEAPRTFGQDGAQLHPLQVPAAG